MIAHSCVYTRYCYCTHCTRLSAFGPPHHTVFTRTLPSVTFAQAARMNEMHCHSYILPHPDTARRLHKRLNAYFAILRTPEYHVAYSLWTHGHIPSMPWAPDPFDLSVSKRRWEASIQTWRNALQQLELYMQYCLPAT